MVDLVARLSPIQEAAAAQQPTGQNSSQTANRRAEGRPVGQPGAAAF
jgi:hypothetical protein